MPQYQQKTKFPGVYSDKDGKYFLQTASTPPYRTQVQPAASFLVCSLIFH